MERNAAKETAALAAAHLRRLAVLLEKKQLKNVCISDEKVAQPRPTLGTFSAKTFPKTITHASRGFSGTARVHMVCTGLSSDEKKRKQNAKCSICSVAVSALWSYLLLVSLAESS